MSDSDQLTQRALLKKAEGRGMTNDEIGALQAYERALRNRAAALQPRRPIQVNYQPRGVSPAQLADRIHTSQEAGAGGGDGGGGPVYTFTACVSGSPMSFDIQIMRGPY